MTKITTALLLSLITSKDEAQRKHGIALAKEVVANGKDAAQRDMAEQILNRIGA